MIGLLEAARNYDVTQGASFETYAGIRVRGSMLDELRKNDWAPKSVHRKARELTEAVRAIEHRTGEDAKDEEIAAELGISLDEYYKILQNSNTSKILNFDESIGTDHSADDSLTDREEGPLDKIQSDDQKNIIANAIDHLPEREKMVVTLYYAKELNLREIGEVLNVSESRISQLLSQALLRLRARLADQ
jgi:RNA polymerase sigma factor for flagellar operon FliA